ncbi:MAG: hypothetical protein V1874_11240 [Spirochaetota bacterium]
MNFKKSFTTTICSVAVAALCSGALSAQEAAKEAPKQTPIDVSGVLFFDYSYILESKDKLNDANTLKKRDSFNLNRAYVNFNKKIDDVWSAKVTLDGGTLAASDTNKTSVEFVKNAYFQMNNDFGVAGLKIQGGMTGTPIIGLIDGLNGSRWIYQNYIDKASDVSDKSIDVSSADTGVKAELNVMKMITISGMYSNGDGYKKAATDQDTVTKAYYGVVNVTPISALNIFGYYHWHDTAMKSKENYVSFIGGGAAWSDKYFKIGAAYTMHTGKASDIKEESSLMEVWANVNLQQITNVPILIIGRYAMGEYEKKGTGTNKLKNEGSAIWGGAGYQVNSNVQFAAMYKVDTLSKKANDVKTSDMENSTFFIKSEIKF